MNPTAGPDGFMMAHPSPGVDSISGRAFSARRSSSVAQARAARAVYAFAAGALVYSPPAMNPAVILKRSSGGWRFS